MDAERRRVLRSDREDVSQPVMMQSSSTSSRSNRIDSRKDWVRYVGLIPEHWPSRVRRRLKGEVGLIPVAGLVHRIRTFARLADTVRSVYGRRQPLNARCKVSVVRGHC